MQSNLKQLASDNVVEDYFHVDNLSVSFGDTDVVRALSMTLKQGEIGCLLGFSGCGKTTALRAIAGLEQPRQGYITLNGKDLTNICESRVMTQVPPAKRDMGMVFQDYALFTHLRVSENIGFGLHQWPKADRQSRIDEMLALVELTDHAHKRISELSGGQQQRIALARALAPKPDLLLLDEPFSNLDMMLRESLASKVRDILKSTNTTAILVTHDQHEAFAIADKIGVMHQGKLSQWATPSELYHQPNSPFVAEFVGEGAMIDGVVEHGIIKTALGSIKRYPEPIHSHNPSEEADFNVTDCHANLNHAMLADNQSHSSEKSKEQAVIQKEVEKRVEERVKDENYSYDYANGTKIKVLIRPDDIVHDDDSTQQAIVVARVFRGANYLYRLKLQNGEEILSLIPSHHDHPIGSAIGFRPLLAHVVLFQGDSMDTTTWHRI